ncbi:dihydromonapterin reductase [Thiosulfativibrio zosterae]|uniref:Dihydromonapterin reductase n=1 Tax=Thiosulfativibrio zosterae TaxID=2675053 RepID=A0A6F8PKG2_9GAMM|nr:dihydromonapterin reductase [Thiosulfativibrio zosterae]BBP42591.1 dihydromonapterin reductase [Thiosulfativibrio zosterae]
MLQDAVLITGAGQRIGFYLAEAFLQRTTHPVVFTYRTYRPSVQALLDQGAMGFQVDFTDDLAVQVFLQDFLEQVSSCRAVIHNASIWARESQLFEQPHLWQDMMAVHVRAPYLINQACEPLLKAGSHLPSDIIHITDAKLNEGQADQVAYLASKAALHSMTLSFAKALAPAIKVNEIQPGLVIFNENDDENYRQKRLAEMSIPTEPGAETIWQMVQTLMALPNTTGSAFRLSND